MLNKARGFLLLDHFGFPLRKARVDLQARTSLEISKQVFVDLIFIVNEECRVQLLLGPVEVVVKLEEHEYLGGNKLTAFSSSILWVNSHRGRVGGRQTRTGGVSAVLQGEQVPTGVH